MSVSGQDTSVLQHTALQPEHKFFKEEEQDDGSFILEIDIIKHLQYSNQASLDYFPRLAIRGFMVSLLPLANVSGDVVVAAGILMSLGTWDSCPQSSLEAANLQFVYYFMIVLSLIPIPIGFSYLYFLYQRIRRIKAVRIIACDSTTNAIEPEKLNDYIREQQKKADEDVLGIVFFYMFYIIFFEEDEIKMNKTRSQRIRTNIFEDIAEILSIILSVIVSNSWTSGTLFSLCVSMAAVSYGIGNELKIILTKTRLRKEKQNFVSVMVVGVIAFVAIACSILIPLNEHHGSGIVAIDVKTTLLTNNSSEVISCNSLKTDAFHTQNNECCETGYCASDAFNVIWKNGAKQMSVLIENGECSLNVDWDLEAFNSECPHFPCEIVIYNNFDGFCDFHSSVANFEFNEVILCS